MTGHQHYQWALHLSSPHLGYLLSQYSDFIFELFNSPISQLYFMNETILDSVKLGFVMMTFLIIVSVKVNLNTGMPEHSENLFCLLNMHLAWDSSSCFVRAWHQVWVLVLPPICRTSCPQVGEWTKDNLLTNTSFSYPMNSIKSLAYLGLELMVVALL